MRNRFIWMKFALVAILLLSSTSLYAQQQYGELVVRVSDQTGGVLPGTAVILTSGALIRPVEGVTDSTGLFRYSVLPSGEYTVTASAPGFTTAVQEEVIVEIGRTYTINLALDVATVEETVTVTAVSPTVDTIRSESSGTFKGDDLAKSPGARDYTEFAAYMPSVNIDPMTGDAAHKGTPDGGQGPNSVAGISVDGSSGAENVFYVDGIDTTSMYNGYSNQGIRTETVQEFQVKTAGYEAQYGGAMGGVMSVVTKSGGNRFNGSGFYYFRGSSLNAGPRQRLRLDPESDIDVAQYVTDPEDDQTTHEIGFTLGGPIVRDRVWFFASVIPQFTDRSRTVNFTSGDTGEYTRSSTLTNFLGKIDYQPTDTLRLTGSFATDPNDVLGKLPSYDGTDNYDFLWADSGNKYPSRTYNLSASYVPNTSFLIDGRFGMNYLGTEQKLEPPGVRHFFLQSNGKVGFSSDDPNYRPRSWAEYGYSDGLFTEFDDQDKSTIAVAGSYFLVGGGGQHNLKFGYQFNRLSNNVNDAYRYDYIRYYWGDTYHAIDGTDHNSSCVGPDGVTYNPCGYADSRYPMGVVADIHTDRHALYFQDGWTIGDRFTLNAGVRMEAEAIPSFSDIPEFSGSAYEWGFGDKLAPRLGASYDVRGDGKVKAFGSWGWFYDSMKLEMAQGSFGGFKWISHYSTLNQADLDWLAAGNLNGEGPHPGDFIEDRNWRIPSFEDLDPDLKAMRMTEAVAGLEWEVAPRQAVSFRYVHKSVDEAIEDVGRQTPAGEAYYITNPGRGYSVSKFVEAGLPPTPRPERSYNALETRWRKRFANRWAADISYTYSRLHGLYSGLGSSDENGRLSPNVNRDFDLWFLNLDSYGNPLSGPLNTDRPHQVKANFVYDTPFGLTTSVFFRAMSGAPITRTVDLEYVDIAVENRGSDGRNPMWTQLDLFLNYSLSPFQDPGKRIEINFNIINLLNTGTTLRTYRSMNRITAPLWSPGDPVGPILDGYDYNQILADNNIDQDPRFLKPDRFLSPISARFGIKFIF